MNGWRDDKPTIGVVVEVWFWATSSIQRATWTGKAWLNEVGQEMIGVTHWRAIAS
jgi:hypothetical protein